MEERRGKHFSSVSLTDDGNRASTIGTADHMVSYGQGTRMSVPVYGGAAALYVSGTAKPASRHTYVGHHGMGTIRHGDAPDTGSLPFVDVDESDDVDDDVPHAEQESQSVPDEHRHANRILDKLLPHIESDTASVGDVTDEEAPKQPSPSPASVQGTPPDDADSDDEPNMPTGTADISADAVDNMSPSPQVQVYFPEHTQTNDVTPHADKQVRSHAHMGIAPIVIGAATLGIVVLGIGRYAPPSHAK